MSKRLDAASKKRKIENKEEDLPRGGGSDVTPLEVKKIHKQADADFMFEIKSGKGKKGKNGPAKKNTQKKHKVEGPLEDENLGGLASSVTAFNFPKIIEYLRFQVLAPLQRGLNAPPTPLLKFLYNQNPKPGAETFHNLPTAMAIP
jgi:hypothetical protein